MRLCAFHMEIIWDEGTAALLVREKSPQYTQAQLGHIYMPRSSMHVFIHSNENGWLKQVILSQLDVYQRMKGVMLTMGDVHSNVYMPIALPVVMEKRPALPADMLGEIATGSKLFARYRAELQSVEAERYAAWIGLAS
jgi:hypothetical protein